MKERIFVMTSPKFQGSVTYHYAENGYLKILKNEAQMDAELHGELLKKATPIHISQMLEMKKNIKHGKVEEMPADLSFERFWKTYGNFAGKKKRCEQLWNALNDTERTQCLNYISIYKSAKSRDGTALAYPETYINNRVWEI
ncbi:hypothetical protein [Ornithobacterium rhinotracheale]|uniref:hypothetical protein n=1 Tax=Ornithobacterium rhinotracheale TaxID=28251 RepID=UPI0040365D1B